MHGPPTPFAERVLETVERIPRGKVMSYSDVAEFLGAGGGRAVGRVMSEWGSDVAWWRVVRADGSPARGHEAEALLRLRRERTPLHTGGGRVDMTSARWDGR